MRFPGGVKIRGRPELHIQWNLAVLTWMREYLQRGEIEGQIIGGPWRFRRADPDALFAKAPVTGVLLEEYSGGLDLPGLSVNTRLAFAGLARFTSYFKAC